MSDTKKPEAEADAAAHDTAIPLASMVPRPSQLTAAHKALVEEWFQKKAAKHDPKCPICGTGNWTVLDDFVTPTTYSDTGALIFGGFAYPHFMLACTNCGNVQFINAIQAGVVKPGAST